MKENAPLNEPTERTSPSLLEWGKKLLDDENNPVFQFIKGPTLVMAAALGGAYSIPLVLATGTALATIGLRRGFNQENRAKQNLVRLYKHEIAAGLDKEPQKITVADLEQFAADAKAKGQQSALTKELDAIHDYYPRQRKIGFATTAIMTALTLTAAVTSLGDSLRMVGDGLGYAAITGVVGKIVHDAIDKLADLTVAPKIKGYGSVNRAISIVNERLKSHRLEPDVVFAVFVQADDTLRKDIRQKYGDDYRDLPIMTKQQVVEAYDQQYHAKAWTEAINQQQVRPTELGFVAYGQQSAYGAAAAAEPLPNEPQQAPKLVQGPNTERVLLARSEPAAKTLH